MNISAKGPSLRLSPEALKAEEARQLPAANGAESRARPADISEGAYKVNLSQSARGQAVKD